MERVRTSWSSPKKSNNNKNPRVQAGEGVVQYFPRESSRAGGRLPPPPPPHTHTHTLQEEKLFALMWCGREERQYKSRNQEAAGSNSGSDSSGVYRGKVAWTSIAKKSVSVKLYPNPQPPTSQPSQRGNVHVYESIPAIRHPCGRGKRWRQKAVWRRCGILFTLHGAVHAVAAHSTRVSYVLDCFPHRYHTADMESCLCGLMTE